MEEASENRNQSLGADHDLKHILSQIGVEGKWLTQKNEADLDLIVQQKDGLKTFIEIKRIAPIRYGNLDATLALSMLQLRRAVISETNERSLLVLIVPEINDRLKAQVSTFIEKHVDVLRLNWLILAESGRYYSSMNGKSSIGQVNESKKTRSMLDVYIKDFSKGSKKPRTPLVGFSGNHQWMLKCLLLNGIDKKYWGAEDFIGQWNSNTLKIHAGFNTATQAHHLLTELEETGHLIKSNGRIEFRELKRLLADWAYAYRTEKHLLLPVAPLYPSDDFEKWQGKKGGFLKHFANVAQASNIPLLIGGHAGCGALGAGWSNNQSILIHAPSKQTPSLEKFLRAMELKITENKNSPIQIEIHKSMKPVLDIYEFHDDRIPTADVIQCALDVIFLGGRGEEQAEHLYEKILYPHFKRMGWSL